MRGCGTRPLLLLSSEHACQLLQMNAVRAPCPAQTVDLCGDEQLVLRMGKIREGGVAIRSMSTAASRSHPLRYCCRRRVRIVQTSQMPAV